jgi:formyl-CoA transferase
VLFSVQNEREWVSLCEHFLERPELTADPRFATGSDRVAHREELNEIVAARFGRSDSDDVTKALDDAGIANTSVNDIAEFVGHPVLAARERWVDVATPGGVVRALRPPADLAGLDARMEPVPALGAHTAHILTAQGRTPEEIARLRADGVI